MQRLSFVDMPYKPYLYSDLIRELYDAGLSVGMICWRFKIKEETVLRWVDKSVHRR
jgi:hypothetical protein